MPLLSLAQTWVPGVFPPKITIRIRLLQWLHDSGRGSTRALLAPSDVASQIPFQPPWILGPMKHCSASVCICVRACVRVCPRPTTWPDSRSLFGEALGVPQSELQSGKWGFRNHCGLDSPSVAGGERIRGTRRLWARALVTPLRGLSIYVKNKKKNKEKKIHCMNPSLNSPPLSRNP